MPKPAPLAIPTPVYVVVCDRVHDMRRLEAAFHRIGLKTVRQPDRNHDHLFYVERQQDAANWTWQEYDFHNTAVVPILREADDFWTERLPFDPFGKYANK